jgi:dethiobiotin synthetase
MSLFITGTDTGAGKTWVTAALVKTMRAEGRDAVAAKPVCCGGRGDAEILAEASGGLPVGEINPLYFDMPLAPAVAAAMQGLPVDPSGLVAACRGLLEKHETVVFEGIGGWEVPIGPGFRVSDLAAALGLPVVVVVANRLGALNHAALTVNAVRATRTPGGSRLSCPGIVVNEMNDEPGLPEISNLAALEELTGVPVLAHVIHGQEEIRLDGIDGEP